MNARRGALLAGLVAVGCHAGSEDSPGDASAAADVASTPGDAPSVVDAGVMAAPDARMVLDAARADIEDLIDVRTPDGGADDAGLPHDVPHVADVLAPPPPCRTRITYGDDWDAPPAHPLPYDDVDGLVTWDGVCTDDPGGGSVAHLSNGWAPHFHRRGRCTVALDASHCPGAATACTTRFTYGAAWLHAPGHAAQFDDVAGLAAWDGACHPQSGGTSIAVLSNGWRPTFTGSAGCVVGVRQTQCGAQYVNPVLGEGCADPGVLRDGDTYVVACTSGGAADAFPLHTSTDLVHWRPAGAALPASARPSWAVGDFWAPEVHRVGSSYMLVYSARQSNGRLAIGAAFATTATGPFADLGHPLAADPAVGLIDASFFEDSDGARYLLWKEDGNAASRPTPIRAQRLSADGRALAGSPTTLITNDRAWEGTVVEGPWLVAHGGSYYLFYSGSAYYDTRYAVGVARAASVLGPYTKAAAPIVTSGGPWVGPGHCSVVDAPGGGTAMVFHAWPEGFVNGPFDVRQMLVDRVQWTSGWPSLPGAPSSSAVAGL